MYLLKSRLCNSLPTFIENLIPSHRTKDDTMLEMKMVIQTPIAYKSKKSIYELTPLNSFRVDIIWFVSRKSGLESKVIKGAIALRPSIWEAADVKKKNCSTKNLIFWSRFRIFLSAVNGFCIVLLYISVVESPSKWVRKNNKILF